MLTRWNLIEKRFTRAIYGSTTFNWMRWQLNNTVDDAVSRLNISATYNNNNNNKNNDGNTLAAATKQQSMLMLTMMMMMMIVLHPSIAKKWSTRWSWFEWEWIDVAGILLLLQQSLLPYLAYLSKSSDDCCRQCYAMKWNQLVLFMLRYN